MRIIGDIEERSTKTLVNYIQRRNGDCEPLRNRETWYGRQISCLTLFCSYGAIGYNIEYDGVEVQVDNELNEITIL